jgi:hypothetical protein
LEENLFLKEKLRKKIFLQKKNQKFKKCFCCKSQKIVIPQQKILDGVLKKVNIIFQFIT